MAIFLVGPPKGILAVFQETNNYYNNNECAFIPHIVILTKAPMAPVAVADS